MDTALKYLTRVGLTPSERDNQCCDEKKVESVEIEDYRIRFMELDFFLKQGKIPKYNKSFTVELDKIDRDSSLLIFVSHAWLQGNGVHPDTPTHDKYSILCKGLKLCHRLIGPELPYCYIWIDYSCSRVDAYDAAATAAAGAGDGGNNDYNDTSIIDSNSSKREKHQTNFQTKRPPPHPPLVEIIKACDVLFTPIVDKDCETWSFPATVQSWFTDYQSNAFNARDNDLAYMNRAWCRLEMMISYYVPLTSKLSQLRECKTHSDSQSQSQSHSQGDATSNNNNNSSSRNREMLLTHHQTNQRPHLLYGSKEVLHDWSPLVLPPQTHSLCGTFFPWGGKVTSTHDMFMIQSLTYDLLPYIRTSLKIGGYVGQVSVTLDAKGKEITQRQGYGCYFYGDGSTYCGGWEGGASDGQGVMFYADTTTYTGTFKKGLPDGEGVCNFPDKSSYKGSYKAGLKSGFGRYVYATKADSPDSGDIYEGDYLDDRRHGYGTLTSVTKGWEYKGHWEDGMRHGHGETFVFDSRVKHVGFYHKNNYEGRGTLTYEDDSCNEMLYEGDFHEGKRHGAGKMTYRSGDVYEGNWSNNIRDVAGVLTTATEIFRGMWANDEIEYGTVTFYPSGDVYTGAFENFIPHGQGTCVYAADGSTYKGSFVHGRQEGSGFFISGTGGAYEVCMQCYEMI